MMPVIPGTGIIKKWSRREELNAPSADYRSAALTLSYTGTESRESYFEYLKSSSITGRIADRNFGLGGILQSFLQTETPPVNGSPRGKIQIGHTLRNDFRQSEMQPATDRKRAGSRQRHEISRIVQPLKTVAPFEFRHRAVLFCSINIFAVNQMSRLLLTRDFDGLREQRIRRTLVSVCVE